MADDTEPPRKRVRFSSSEGPSVDSKPILIRVGEVKQEFYVHESLLRANSLFFDNALKKEWKEGQERVVDLPDTEPEHMRIWIKFLYTGRIFTGTETPQIRESEAELFCKDVSAWNRLYTLGDFLQDGDFKDALIDAMMEFTAILNAYPIRLPDFIYSHSTKDSAHRRFVVDIRLYKRITVLVGNDESFTVDKSTLLTSSEFFKKTLGTSLKTNGPEEVDLPDAKPRAFEIYLGWLETGYFYITEEHDIDSPPQSDKNGCILDGECNKWNECYTLGNVIQDCGFQDACIDWIQEKMISDEADLMNIPDIVYGIDDRLPAHRQFTVDIAAHCWSSSVFGDLKEDRYPSEFMIDLLKYVGPKLRLSQVVEQDYKVFFENVGCKYHEHARLKKPCYKETHPAYK
ncbi:uncharacterized protein J4E78_008496 [Alternaria triticimaculans]|uniref:uncharacterized protein n=1 Tax=Alternaria triticimaculans TaxID=297637 RepID=UPI0020C2EEF3|nr:uncharacterized protein J4E78_008496 [Alternaria triticimaculans]KAI4648979.1 hypothetical protein J4E78_008496 [Alternaria triticimaculans]